MVTQAKFGNYTLFTVTAGDLSASVCDLGATLVSLHYRGRETVLGYDSSEAYLAGHDYLGATIGRYGNRIGNARFALNGVEYRLTPNEGPNQLHGGPQAFDRQRWTVEIPDDAALRFTLCSPDGENGFPGTLNAAVTYRICGDALRIDFEGDSDRDTPFAPTNHSYFDLAGNRRCLEAGLWLGASRYVEPGEGLIPTGRLLPAEGDFDFHRLRPVSRDYDHAFVLDGTHACTLCAGGLKMELHTDFPAVQIYTGSGLNAPFGKNAGLAIEPEFFPDSPNRPDFPDTVLRAGEHFHRWAEYRFSEA